ncbi:MAG: chlorinating enzyme [Bacteroidota bacterium]
MDQTDNQLAISLTPEEKALFFKQGFIGPFRIYEEKEAKHILRQVRIKNNIRTNILFNNDVNYDRHFDISELSRHVCNPGIVGRVSSILGEDLICWRSEFFPKFPGAKGTEWHQVGDHSYATGEPMLVPTAQQEGMPLDLTVWTAFTDATIENGCLKFMPGSQNKMYFDSSKVIETGRDAAYRSVEADTSFYGYNFADFKIDDSWEPDESKAVAMEMKPGECVLFSSKCMHGSYPNITERNTRFAISARYLATHVQVYPNAESFQAHGGHFDLTHYGPILVSGKDDYGHNRLRTENNLGETFRWY